MAESIRDSIRIRIVTPDSIRYSIREQTADSQVPNADMMKSPERPICASALGCGTLYHVRNADSKHQDFISLLGSAVPLKYRTSVSPESINTTSACTFLTS